MPKALSQSRLHIGLGIEHVRRTRNQAQEVRDYPEIALITLKGCLRLSRDGFFRRNSNASHKFSLFLCQCSDALSREMGFRKGSCALGAQLPLRLGVPAAVHRQVFGLESTQR